MTIRSPVVRAWTRCSRHSPIRPAGPCSTRCSSRTARTSRHHDDGRVPQLPVGRTWRCFTISPPGRSPASRPASRPPVRQPLGVERPLPRVERPRPTARARRAGPRSWRSSARRAGRCAGSPSSSPRRRAPAVACRRSYRCERSRCSNRSSDDRRRDRTRPAETGDPDQHQTDGRCWLNRCLAITMRWIWLVPSWIWVVWPGRPTRADPWRTVPLSRDDCPAVSVGSVVRWAVLGMKVGIRAADRSPASDASGRRGRPGRSIDRMGAGRAIVEARRDEINELVHRHHGRSASLFGSAA